MDSMFILVGVLMSVAFFTLMERKIMGLMHYRKGPNKLVFMGLTQPMADALKLLTKETTKASTPKMAMFLIGPMLMMMVMMLCWGLYESVMNSVMSSSLKILMILTIMSTSVYGLILTSWGSNSKYALLGGYRAIAQTISYEVCLALHVIALVLLYKTLSINEMKLMQTSYWAAVAMVPLLFSWVMLCMAESNRTPFDLAEGESELVSGFNVEYGGGLFTLIFISEYGMMVFLSFLTAFLFFGGSMMTVKMMILCGVFIWVRSSFPRVRYDNLMMISWKLATPYSLAMIMASVSI